MRATNKLSKLEPWAPPASALKERTPILPLQPAEVPSPEARNTLWRGGLMGVGRVLHSFANRIEVDTSGIDHLLAQGPIRGAITLVLGHTGYDDATRSVPILWPILHPVPLVTESIRFAPGIKGLIDLTHGFSVANSANPAGSAPELEYLIKKVVDAIEAGHNVLWYPSGEILKVGEERFHGHMLFEYVKAELERRGLPVRVIVVQQTGGNGSRSTRAGNGGKKPDIAGALKADYRDMRYNALNYPLTSLWNWSLVKEKRPLGFRVFDATNEMLGAGSMEERNALLHEWSNVPDEETGKPHQARQYGMRWDDPFNVRLLDTVDRSVLTARSETPPEEKAANVLKVREFVARFAKKPLDEVKEETALDELPGISSVHTGQMVEWVNATFGRLFDDADAFGLRPTVGDLARGANGEIDETSGLEPKPVSKEWDLQRINPKPATPPKNVANFGDGFIKAVMRAPDRIIIHDELAGEISNKKLAAIVCKLADQFDKLPGQKVGVLFPNSAMGLATYFAALFAGKTPVLFNPQWTDEQAAHVVKVAGLKAIITPMEVIRGFKAKKIREDEDAIKKGEKTPFEVDNDKRETSFGSIEHLFHPFEDDFRKIPDIELLAATTKLGWLYETPAIEQLKERLENIPEEVAAIFTSGSTGMPKGVIYKMAMLWPVISELAEKLEVNTADVFLQIAPSFHLVGYMANLMAFFFGVQSTAVPDPRKAAFAAKIAKHRGATLCAGTPSLLSAFTRVAGKLPLMRNMLFGAEQFKADQAEQMEFSVGEDAIRQGFGASEANIIGVVKKLTKEMKAELAAMGIDWKSVVAEKLDCVETRFLDPFDTTLTKQVKKGDIGVFVARGPGVITKEQGYMKLPDGSSPAKPTTWVDIDDKSFYNLEDLMREVTIKGPKGKPVNLLVYCGRQGRFSKVGGEMIGHEAIEKVVAEVVKPRADGKPSAFVSFSPEGVDAPPMVWVASTRDREDQPLTMRRVHEALMTAFRRNPNYGVSQIRVVDEIKLLGTGKANLKHYTDAAKLPFAGPVIR